MNMKSYRGRLAKPDLRDRWRAVVGRTQDGKQQRFQIGNKWDTSEVFCFNGYGTECGLS